MIDRACRSSATCTYAWYTYVVYMYIHWLMTFNRKSPCSKPDPSCNLGLPRKVTVWKRFPKASAHVASGPKYSTGTRMWCHSEHYSHIWERVPLTNKPFWISDLSLQNKLNACISLLDKYCVLLYTQPPTVHQDCITKNGMLACGNLANTLAHVNIIKGKYRCAILSLADL